MTAAPATSTPAARAVSWWRMLLGALAPSWRLFDEPDATPLLQLRAIADDDTAGPWRAAPAMAPTARTRSWLRLLVNDAETMRLAACSSVDRLAAEVNACDDTDALTASTSWALVERLAAQEARALGLGPRWQWQIVVDNRASATVDGDGDGDVVVRAAVAGAGGGA